MRRKLTRIPIPLMMALAVAVGVAVTIVIQVTVFTAPPAVVAPIETSATSLASGSSTYSISINVVSGDYVIYPTLAGLGKLQLQANTTGWYFLQNDWFVTVVRRSTGDATFTLSNGHMVYVKEINTTHAFIFYDAYSTGVVAKKVQVGSTGWYVYHPVATNYDTTTINAIKNFLLSSGYYYVNVFQPKADYVAYDPTTKSFYVYFDSVYNDGTVSTKYFYYTNTTNFQPVPISTAVTVNGIERIDTYNYVLYPVWAMLYSMATSNTNYAITITPTK